MRNALRDTSLASTALPTLLLLLLSYWLPGCASVPQDRYGVDSIEIEGAEQMDAEAMAVCLVTRERPRITLQLGMEARPTCGSPPFDSHPARIGLWRWSWTDWPLYDEIVFERDLERIVRWYQARGYYDAEVLEWRIEPPAAADSDTVAPETECEREDDDEGCVVQISVVVYEGEPVHISEVHLEGAEDLPPQVQQRLSAAMTLREGQRFDEADYEAVKSALRATLAEASYARAEVTGRVHLNRETRLAAVRLNVDAGPACRFGIVTVRGNRHAPKSPIYDAANIQQGAPYSTSAIRDAQAAVYDIGAFGAVNVHPDMSGTGPVIPVVVEVAPSTRSRFHLGAGVQSGLVTQGPTEQTEEVPQWDVHLLGSWEHRNFLGGLRRFRLEEQPRLIFNNPFPKTDDPRFGNLVSLTFRQPAFPEARTTMRFESVWDYGPDPYLDVSRHQVDLALGLERFFAHRRVFVDAGIQESFYLPVPGERSSEVTVPASSDLMYLEQDLRVDLRDDPLRTRLGLHFALSLHESGYFLPSSWDYVRMVPDLHVYLPLVWDIVLLTRFSVGAIFLDGGDSDLDDVSRTLGPTTERLRGGGGTTNRGFFAGELGDGPEGGTRRWLATAELRLPLLRSFFITLFADAGDVARDSVLRFDHPQLSSGLGFRLITPIGPISLDFGWRIPGAQVLADTDQRDPGGRLTRIDLLLFDFPGAVNLTLGDAF